MLYPCSGPPGEIDLGRSRRVLGAKNCVISGENCSLSDTGVASHPDRLPCRSLLDSGTALGRRPRSSRPFQLNLFAFAAALRRSAKLVFLGPLIFLTMALRVLARTLDRLNDRKGANDIVVSAWRYAALPGPHTTAERTAVFKRRDGSGLSVVAPPPPRSHAKTRRIFIKSPQSRTAAEKPQAPELRNRLPQLLRWYRLSYLLKETAVGHAHGTPRAEVKRWV
jgi:hypothetical protein